MLNGQPTVINYYLGEPKTITEIGAFTFNWDRRANQDFEVRWANNAEQPGVLPVFGKQPDLTTGDVNGFKPALAPGDPLHYLVSAELLYLPGQMEREDGGIRIERVVRNLTDAGRTGTRENPFHIGDQLRYSDAIV